MGNKMRQMNSGDIIRFSRTFGILFTDSPLNSLPVLIAVFPGVSPPKSTPFNVYKPDAEDSKTKKKRRILEADTGKVEFVGQNFGDSSRQGFCR